MTSTATLTTTNPMTAATSPSSARRADDPHRIRSTRDDVGALPSMLRSEWTKLVSLRANAVILALTVALGAGAAWAVATLVTDQVLTVSDAFVYPAIFTAVLAAVSGILLFTSETQHGTLATALTAQPARWVVAASKTTTAVAVGLVLGAAGMAAAAAGAWVGGLELGDTSAMATTAVCGLLYTTFAAVLGLGIGMIARHSAGAISGLLVWWFVVENLIVTFAPARIAHVLPFAAGYRLLGVGSDFDTPEIVATALARPQYALVFAGYAATALVVGTVLLYRRDTN